MPDWRPSFWLVVASIYALANGVGDWNRWANLAFWTRVHTSLNVCTGLSMLLGAIGLLVVRSGLRWVVSISAAAAALLGTSLIAGALLGTIPCTGPT